MNKLAYILLVILLGTLIIACKEVDSEMPNELSFCLGDEDGFGMGLKEGDSWIPGTPGGPLPIDKREIDDPYFTDIYPANFPEENGAPAGEHWVSYTHEFDVGHREIISAKFSFITLGVQDANLKMTAYDSEIKLFIDDMEIPNAFDDIEQVILKDGKWYSVVGTLEIVIPGHMLSALKDGVVNVKWEILQLDPNFSNIDAFAIDCSELVLTVVDSSI